MGGTQTENRALRIQHRERERRLGRSAELVGTVFNKYY
jgi:hypothetical protein